MYLVYQPRKYAAGTTGAVIIHLLFLGISSRALVCEEGPIGGEKSSLFLVYFNKTNIFLGEF